MRKGEIARNDLRFVVAAIAAIASQRRPLIEPLMPLSTTTICHGYHFNHISHCLLASHIERGKERKRERERERERATNSFHVQNKIIFLLF